MTTDTRISFFDLDETLLASDHKSVTPRTQNALRNMHKAGILLAVATGRSRSHIPECINELPFDYLISANGADIVQVKNNTHLYNDYIPAQDAALAWQLLKPFHLFVEWFTDNEVGIDADTCQRLEELTMPKWHREYFLRNAMPVFDTVEQYLQNGAPKLEKINLPRFDPEMRNQIWQTLSDCKRFTLSSSSGRNVEINRFGCTKGRAIKALCDQLAIPIEHTLAFGDGGNDMEMLETVGFSVAMGNASELLKSKAKAIAAPYDQDGVAQFIESTVL